MLVQLEAHNAAQHPIALPVPGEEGQSAVDLMYEEGRGRSPQPPTANALQRAVRRVGARTLGGAGRSMPPPGVERSALDNLADIDGPIRQFHLGRSGGMKAYLPVGAAYPDAMQRPAAPRRGNTFRRRPNPANAAKYVNLVPAQES